VELESLLRQLEHTNLVHRTADADVAYSFKHLLTQEAAYQSLLVRRRREVHRRVAECYEQVYADRLDEYAALLAQHYAQAGNDTKTLDYAKRAGDQAMRIYATAEAVMHFTHALEIARRSEASTETLTHLYTRRGRALELGSQFDAALANYQEMEALARERGDHALELAALIARGTVLGLPTPVSDVVQAEAVCTQALALAREMSDYQAEAKILWNLLLINGFSGKAREAVDYGERSIAIARRYNLREQLAYTLNDLYFAYMPSGQLDRALAALAEARTLWRELGNQPMLADNLASTTPPLFWSGQYEQVLAQSDEAIAISESIGNLWGRAYSRAMRGYVYWEYGEFSRAIEAMKECVRLAEQANFSYPLVMIRADLGLLYGQLGALERGFELVKLGIQAAEGAVQIDQAWAVAILARLHVLNGDLAAAAAAVEASRARLQLANPTPFSAPLAEGEVALAQGDYERAIAALDRVLADFQKLGIRPFTSDALYFKGKALLAQERLGEAHESLQAARAQAEALGSRRSLWPILLALNEVAAQRGDPTQAEALRRQAHEIVRYIADHIHEPDLRESFLCLPRVRAVIEHGELTQ
jgi:tetratricopeptide (TPR) repeat protein